MNQLSFSNSAVSKSKIIASSGIFQIELLNQAGEDDFPQLISISKSLEKNYGKKAILTNETIQKYFNKEGSLPFIARYRDLIFGYICTVYVQAFHSQCFFSNNGQPHCR